MDDVAREKGLLRWVRRLDSDILWKLVVGCLLAVFCWMWQRHEDRLDRLERAAAPQEAGDE